MWNLLSGEPVKFESLMTESENEFEEDDVIEEAMADDAEEEQAGDRAAQESVLCSNCSCQLVESIYSGDGFPLYPGTASSRTAQPSPAPAPQQETVTSPLAHDDMAVDPLASSEASAVVIVECDGHSDNDDGDDPQEPYYVMADQHTLHAAPEGFSNGRRRGRGGRGRGRRGGHLHAGSARPQDWHRGDRLVEVYVTDDDVPEELRAMIMSVVEKREARERMAARRVERDQEEDIFHDADDGGDAVLFGGDESALHFDWRPMDSFRGEREQFLPQQTGPTAASESVYEAFRQYWDESILYHIATETNRHASVLAASSAAFARDWYDTNIHEILVLFSFWMMLGIIRMPSTKSCFTVNPLLKTSIYRTMFTRNRYERLCSALSFNNDENKTPISNPIFPIQPVIDYLNVKFQSLYVPSQEVCIDETLTPWKGQLSFKQFIKTKTARFGVKTFELCESATGYLWSFFVYAGHDSSLDYYLPSSILKSTAIVLNLIRPLLNKGYTLFMDDWFNSPILARFLKRNRTDCVGTLRANLRNVPPLVPHCPLQEGQYLARHAGDTVVLAYQDKKKFVMISTCHSSDLGVTPAKPHSVAQWKPQVILDYNNGMRGVDRKDQLLEPYLLERKKCAKWHLKLFKRLLNVSILNSRILLQKSTGIFKLQLVFRLELVEQILRHHLNEVPKPRGPAMHVSGNDWPHMRMTQNTHWPRTIITKSHNNRIARRRCVWCSSRYHTQRRTTVECMVCDVGLCLEPCFRYYHTLP